ncbi:hypothetical protein F5Y08DRAFT_329531 [Xylaria arbuscula]|nr:hypothetical protein F5Y08DRAFT_329531 [Xylaria arbuscula]
MLHLDLHLLLHLRLHSQNKGAIVNATQSTKDAAVQANESDIASSRPPTKTIRRFAPVPIETTFDSYRVMNKNPHGPAPEPTPDPSPTASQSSLTFSRRFAPQLIETTRREKKAGQAGPATKPTDKTDITPGTNHIYAPKPKRKQAIAQPNKPSARLVHVTAEQDNEAVPRFFIPRRQRPGPSTQRSTRTNSYLPDLDTILSSESGNSSEEEDRVAAPALNLGAPALSDTRSDNGDTWSTRSYDLRDRRESCDEEISGYLLGVAAREAHRQRELEQALSAFPNGVPPLGVEHFFVRDNSEDELQIGDDEPPLRHGPSQLLRRKSTDPGWAVKEMRAHAEKLARMRAETHMSLDDNSDKSDPFTPPPSTGLRASPFGMPFAFHASKPEDVELGKMRKAASPPMLGADLTFRTCPSPQYTRMEPNQPYCQIDRLDKTQRDASGATGLWRGYCSYQTNKLETPSLYPPDLLHTPGTSTPIDPFASAFAASVNGSGTQSPVWVPGGKGVSLHKQRLSGLGEKLEREIGRKEREQVILAEFDNAFVTQVYNYLSLGFPATARAFDDELSKISGICVEELRKDDNIKVGKGFMLDMEVGSSRTSSDSSSADSSGDEQMVSPDVYELEYGKRSRHKPPRWKALKLYIHEWARQHPSLNADDGLGPPAWGVRARRGSWAI